MMIFRPVWHLGSDGGFLQWPLCLCEGTHHARGRHQPAKGGKIAVSVRNRAEWRAIWMKEQFGVIEVLKVVKSYMKGNPYPCD